MKTNNKILAALLLVGLATITNAQTQKNIEVIVNDDNGVITKVVTVNGQQLDATGIAQLEADGDVQIIHLNNSDDMNAGSMVLVKTGNNNVKADQVEISINTDGDEVTKTVMMNGKMLNEAEIVELEASGKLKTININAAEGNSNQIVKMLTKAIHIDNGDRATLGFMTNIKPDGWHVISVSAGSGAEDAGLKTGDIVKFMGERDLTNSTDTVFEQLSQKPQYKEGQMVDFEVERDGKLIYMSVEARKNDSFDMFMKLDGHELGAFSGKSEFISTDEFNTLTFPNVAKNSFIHIVSNNGKFTDLGDMSVNLPEILGNMNIFIADGNSTSKLLGKNHEMSTLSDDLGEYFHTKGGVLVLNVDSENAFALKDGDVIKSINGNDVNSPKDVIKNLIKADNQKKIKLKVIRHKKNKTLKYRK